MNKRVSLRACDGGEIDAAAAAVVVVAAAVVIPDADVVD